MQYKVKAKRGGQYFTFGNVQEGQYGPRLGLKVTPELREMLAEKADGEWLNFSLFVDDGQKPGTSTGGGSKGGRGGRPWQQSDDDLPY